MYLIPRFIHQFGVSAYYYNFAGKCLPWLKVITLLLFAIGLYSAFFIAPPDYQQGESYRIIFIHVPAAWLSLMIYVVMALAGLITLIWHIKVAEATVMAAAPIGAIMTFLALVTGSLWGKPMWGTYWVWDARLSSELILLFLYLGVLALGAAINDRRTASRACAMLALVGIINIPIIHYSVIWWNSLHQGPSISKLDAPSIHYSMLIPLLIMVLAFKFFFLMLLLIRTRTELLRREKHNNWVIKLVQNND